MEKESLDSKVGKYNLPSNEKRDAQLFEYKKLLNEAKRFDVDYEVMIIYMNSINIYNSDKIKSNLGGKSIKINESEAVEFALNEVKKSLPDLIRKKQESKYTISSEEVWKRELELCRISEDSRKKQLEFPLNLPSSFRLQHLI